MTETQAQRCGQRLRSERERLRLSQEQLAAAGGVKRLSQYFYELGDRSPTLEYLLKVQQIGVDLTYVINGDGRSGRPPSRLVSEEQVQRIVKAVVTAPIKPGQVLPEDEQRQLVRMLYRIAVMHVDEPSTDGDASIAGSPA